LLALEAFKPLRAYTAKGRKQFPRSPIFPFLEAESYFAHEADRCAVWKVQPLLTKAAQLARALPPDEDQKDLLETIQEREQMLAINGSLSNPEAFGMFRHVFESMFGGDAEDEEGS